MEAAVAVECDLIQQVDIAMENVNHCWTLMLCLDNVQAYKLQPIFLDWTSSRNIAGWADCPVQDHDTIQYFQPPYKLYNPFGVFRLYKFV